MSLATEQNPNMQMMLPLAEIVSLLQQGVGNLLRQTGLATAKMLNTETRTQTTVFVRSALLFNNELLAKPMTPRKEHEPALSPPRLRVRIGTTPGDQQDLYFGKSFRIGRVEECDVCIKDEYVSRAHAEVLFENGQWWVRDLHSSNGIYIEDQRVELAPVGQSLTMRLGIYGPVVSFEVEPPPPQLKPPITSDTMVARYVERYFAKSAGDETVGEHTRMVRRAYAQVQTKQKWKYGRIMAALVLAIIVAGAYALYLHQQVQKQKSMAQDLFYAMKSLDLDIANVERLVLDSHSQQAMEEIRKYQNRRKEMETNYDRFLSGLRIYNPKMTEQERLILRVARIFGECELAMPRAFMTEIDSYIKKSLLSKTGQGYDRLR